MRDLHTEFLAANDQWESRYQNPTPPTALEILLPQESTVTSRMVAQQGLFTIAFDARQSHDSIIESVLHPIRNAQATDGTVFTKVVIPARLKTTFLRHLRSMNVTA